MAFGPSWFRWDRPALRRIISNWSKRAELQKPEEETELPDSNISESEEEAAIRAERDHRIEQKK